MAKSKKLAGIIYIALIALILIPFDKFGLPLITAPLALLLGLVFAFIFPNPYPKFNKKTSKYLLQVAVVCLGFNMNLQESLRSGSEGMMFTVVSVVGVMALGVLLGYWLHINRKTAYLISSGTAICGGSAIAAVGPVVKANENEIARCDFHIELDSTLHISPSRAYSRHVAGTVRHVGGNSHTRHFVGRRRR